MGPLDIVLLAIVQGLTEFLPVSSSGHVVIVAALLNPSGSPAAWDVVEVNIVLHMGTLLSILVFYGKRVRRLFGRDRRTIGLMFVGTIPAAMVGLLLRTYAKTWLSNPLPAGCLLVITGSVLLAIPRLARGDGPYQQLSYVQAIRIGIAQAVALLPGISRSGMTITAGLANGLSRDSAAAFSFLLAIPAIIGGAVLELKDVAGEQGTSTPLPYLLLGVAVSFATGLFALWWVVRWLERGRLQYFALWCIPVGIAVIIWRLAGFWT
jgi:undecaprenyl-diphosphatase